MQEDVEHRTVSLAVNTAKMTGRVLKEAIQRYLNNRRYKTNHTQNQPTEKAGKVSMKELQKQYGDLKTVELQDDTTRRFERFARKYHVRYSIIQLDEGNYQVFFKAPSEAAMETAFKEFAADKFIRENKDNPSVMEQLRKPKVRERHRHREKKVPER